MSQDKEVITANEANIEDTPTKRKLDLTPNEIVGYRISPDRWNWSVVVVKIKGKESKDAGQQYESPLPAYCKSLKVAVQTIFDRVAKLEARSEQDLKFDKTGQVADLNSIITAVEKAEKAVMWSLNDLEQRIVEAGVDLKNVGRLINKGLDTEEQTEEQEAA